MTKKRLKVVPRLKKRTLGIKFSTPKPIRQGKGFR